ncbi:polyprenyl synthetase family protein [Parvibium lacunae]|uniref:Geranyl transferase n=1 Tax=Parvibium lacunae TaxID=1888893 RepID=A0A368L7L6_9BURK|nr:farnesyl diphosphate synthase [Parvibium lacunae]RCS59239.1 geranyl transferase [Parvibium lacunae]
MTMALSLQEWMQSQAQHVESMLLRHLPARTPSTNAAPQASLDTLHTAMHYAVLDGGKRIRPLLVYAVAPLSATAPLQAFDHAAVAVELIHAYSLVHDDLPCMDNDILRRGKPTVHVRFGEALALLAGDALQTLAFDVLSQTPLPPAQVVTLLQTLAQASGAAGMCGGQAIDLGSVGSQLERATLESMHCLKTGALLRASVRLGAICADLNAAQQTSLDVYASALGLAFQVVDDILDVEADTATLGKTAGKDAAQEKPTYVSLLGLSAAKTLASALREEGRTALQTLAQDLPNTERLAQLLDYVVQRTH